MNETITGLSKSHNCTDINKALAGTEVTVMGWVHKRRDFGKLMFVALRDRSGIVQILVDGNEADEVLFNKANSLKPEYVIAAKGIVQLRAEGNINPDMETGEVEIAVKELRILSEAETPPFHIQNAQDVKDDIRLKYRYLDLRNPELQGNIILRHKTAQIIRSFLNEEAFIEVETPMLTKSTPEGARDYLVPSRVHQGEFYALPQSPQLFKQLLMVSGLEKYYQIVKCFRDEDLRADRQPEFTQIDMELSFVDAEDIMSLNERLIQKVFKETLSVDVKLPFDRMPYKEAMERFGSDKPDTRFGLELVNLTDIVRDTEFVVFKSAIESGGSVRCINAKGMGAIPRKQIDALVELSKTYGAKGLAWVAVNNEGQMKSSIGKFFTDEEMQKILDTANCENGDLILICADSNQVVFTVLGSLRSYVAKKLELYNEDQYNFLWVTDFPLLEWSEEEQRYFAMHHPFTSPLEEDIALLETDPKKVRAKAYDMVVNGVELGGGSVRIHQREVQQKMLNLLGFSDEEAERRFGYLLTAFKYGVPPHGGLAFGFDRLMMLLCKADSLRDVIAFPKVKDASCPLTQAPSKVDSSQLEELGLRTCEQ